MTGVGSIMLWLKKATLAPIKKKTPFLNALEVFKSLLQKRIPCYWNNVGEGQLWNEIEEMRITVELSGRSFLGKGTQELRI